MPLLKHPLLLPAKHMSDCRQDWLVGRSSKRAVMASGKPGCNAQQELFLYQALDSKGQAVMMHTCHHLCLALCVHLVPGRGVARGMVPDPACGPRAACLDPAGPCLWEDRVCQGVALCRLAWEVGHLWVACHLEPWAVAHPCQKNECKMNAKWGLPEYMSSHFDVLFTEDASGHAHP